ncbi:MAG TPA: ferrous iron transport protein B, partial [Bacteroidales bacterium]|nr:ferrous iron transport protein B [Bacteroidales bacterium]
MELPPYRLPTMRNTLRHMWHKASQYLRKMGTVILVASILIWALSYFPQNKELLAEYDQQIAQVELNETLSSLEKEKLVLALELEKE